MALVTCPECGKDVSETAEACPNCGFNVKKHLISLKNAEIQKKRIEMRKERHKRNVKYLKVIIPVFILFVGGISGIIINKHILSGRTVFETEDKMIAFLTKPNSWKYDSEYTERYLIFHQSGLVETLDELFGCEGKKAEFKPKRGKFKVGMDSYYVSDDGDVVKTEGLNNKKRFETHYSPSTFTGIKDDLKIDIPEPTINDGMFETKIKVVNNSSKTYHLVKFRVKLTDVSGKIYFSPHDYAVEVPSPGDPIGEYDIKPNDCGECDIKFSIRDEFPKARIVRTSVDVVSYRVLHN